MGIVIRATGQGREADQPPSTCTEDETSDAILHHVVRVEPGAEVTVLENGPAAARFNKCMEIDVADGGAFHHVRAQGRDHERRAFTPCSRGWGRRRPTSPSPSPPTAC
jgi:Fe-S cluster assembly protein SufD